MELITYENTWREIMKRFAVTAAFVVGAFALTGCDNPTPSDDGVVTDSGGVDFEIDLDGHTKTKTVQAPPPAVPKPQPHRTVQQAPAPVKPAPVPAPKPPAPAPIKK